MLFFAARKKETALEKGKAIVEKMSPDEISAAKALSGRLREPNNFLSALDKYVTMLLVKELAIPLAKK